MRTYSFPGLSEGENPSPRELDQRLRYDRNAVPRIDREHYTYARGLARNLVVWLGCNYQISYNGETGATIDVEHDIAGPYLMKQACAILHYKEKANKDTLLAPGRFPLEDLERQLDLIFEKGFSTMGNWAEIKENRRAYNTLAFGDQTFRVEKKGEPEVFRGILFYGKTYIVITYNITEVDPVKLGTTRSDELFHKGISVFFSSSKSAIRPLKSGGEGDTTNGSDSSGDGSDFERPHPGCKRKRS